MIFSQPLQAIEMDIEVCVNVTEDNNPIISKPLYKDLIKVMDWDIGQRVLIRELSAENNYMMQCLLSTGFNPENIELCVGEKYIKVIEVYTAEFLKLKMGLLDAIIGTLKSKGYDNDEIRPVLNVFKKKLMDDLGDNKDPDLALAYLENEMKEREDYQKNDWLEMNHKLQGNYLIYVSLKKIIKGFVFMTIRCVQELSELVQVEFPEGENPKLYNKGRVEASFPEDEIERVFKEKRDMENELQSMIKRTGTSFNDALAKQGKYKELVTLHLATARVAPGDVDMDQTPEQMFKNTILPRIRKQEQLHLV